MNYQLITNADELRKAIETLVTQPVVGLDTETTELDPYTSRLRLIQLATGSGNLLVNLIHIRSNP